MHVSPVAAFTLRLIVDIYGRYGGCRIALHNPLSILNLRREYRRMSGSSDQIVGGMCRMSDLTKPLRELRDSLDSDQNCPR